MEYVHFLIDFLLHIDVHLAQMVAQYGVWVYAILFAIIFCETGLVVTPFLPGDSLLFVGGALAALPTNELNVHLLVLGFDVETVKTDLKRLLKQGNQLYLSLSYSTESGTQKEETKKYLEENGVDVKKFPDFQTELP